MKQKPTYTIYFLRLVLGFNQTVGRQCGGQIDTEYLQVYVYGRAYNRAAGRQRKLLLE